MTKLLRLMKFFWGGGSIEGERGYRLVRLKHFKFLGICCSVVYCTLKIAGESCNYHESATHVAKNNITWPYDIRFLRQ